MTISGMMVAMLRSWQPKTLPKKQEFTGLFHRALPLPSCNCVFCGTVESDV